jgi:hypothetical protein
VALLVSMRERIAALEDHIAQALTVLLVRLQARRICE